MKLGNASQQLRCLRDRCFAPARCPSSRRILRAVTSAAAPEAAGSTHPVVPPGWIRLTPMRRHYSQSLWHLRAASARSLGSTVMRYNDSGASDAPYVVIPVWPHAGTHPSPPRSPPASACILQTPFRPPPACPLASACKLIPSPSCRSEQVQRPHHPAQVTGCLPGNAVRDGAHGGRHGQAPDRDLVGLVREEGRVPGGQAGGGGLVMEDEGTAAEILVARRRF